MATVYLGLGSNLGEREHNLRKSIELLEQRGITVRKRSALFETKPWGVSNQPSFLNMALEVETSLAPRDLLIVLKSIETGMGRGEGVRWGPRIIDLDILLYNHIILDEDALKIPHPYMHEREFVLRPLSDIAPDVVHPLLKMSIRELYIQRFRKRPRNHGISRY